MTAGTVFYVVAACALVAAVVRLRRARSAPNPPAARSYALIVAALAVSFTTMSATTQDWINQYVLDGGKLVGNLATLTAGFGASAATLWTRWPAEQARPRVRWRLVGLALAGCVLVVTFFWPHPVPLTGSFDGLYAIDPSLAVYTTVYALYLGWVLADFTGLCAMLSRHAPRFLRWGLRLLTLAGALGMVYAAGKLAVVVHRVVTGSRASPGDAQGVCHAAFSSPGCALVVGGPAVVVLVAVSGVLLCAAAARLENVTQWAVAVRDHRRLVPMWRAVTRAAPEAVTSTAAETPADLLVDTERTGGLDRAATEMQHRLARCYAETRDGLLGLAPYRAPGQTGAASSPASAAREVAAAIAAKHAGMEPVQDRPAAPLAALDGQPDWRTDTAWLQQVAAAFNRLGPGAVSAGVPV